MHIRHAVIGIALAASLAVPALANDKKPQSEGDPSSVIQCDERERKAAFELCNWLRQVADGQPVDWLEYMRQEREARKR